MSNFVVTPRYRRYVLWMLTGVYAFNFIDRQILVILQEPIKADLDLSDTQLGLLTGFAFAIFYVTLGIPIARLADKANRKNIVSVALAVWSGMTAVSGLAQNFFQLLLARIGVGVGEAGGSPPAHAMISDYFPPEKRATALATYSTGIYIGVFLGFLVGGIIGEMYGWRTAFFALGVPGILYAVLLYFTVREPVRGAQEQTSKQEELGFIEVVKILLSKRAFLFVAFATGIHTFANYGMSNWFPSFLIRSHEMGLKEVGIWMGLSAGIGGGLGTFFGGYMADRLAVKDVRWYGWLAVIADAFNFFLLAALFFVENTNIVIFTTFLYNFGSAIYLGPAIAMSHNLVSAKMRAMTSAVLFFILNIIGLGFGPLIIGGLSDYLTPTYGTEALRYAMTITLITTLISMFLFHKAAEHYKRERIIEN
ncbi:MAG: spinster family MFS transporter [Saprospiraceae bacterium]